MYSTTGRRRKTGIITRKMAGDSHTTTRRKEPLKHVSLIAHSFGFTVASSLSGAARTAVYSCRQTPHCTARDHGGVVNTGQPRHTRVPGLLYPVSAIPRNLVWIAALRIHFIQKRERAFGGQSEEQQQQCINQRCPNHSLLRGHRLFAGRIQRITVMLFHRCFSSQSSVIHIH